MNTVLCDLFFKYGSDKCPAIGHSYSPIYYEFFKEIKETSNHILEIGVGSHEIMDPLCGDQYIIGASLFAWKDFFENSLIFGLDTDPSCIFETDRIQCIYADQSNPKSLEKAINQIRKNLAIPSIYFNIILDDGSHVVSDMLTSFNTLGKYVSPGGFYIIEDIQEKDLDIFLNLSDVSFDLIKVHTGTPQKWDNFVIYKKNNTNEN